MDKKISNLIIVCFIIAIAILAILAINNPSRDEEQPTASMYPLFPHTEETNYENNSIWNIVNVTSELNKTFYITNSEISDIIEWYENQSNIGEYEILDGGSSGISTTNIDPNNVSYGYVKLHRTNKTQGLFVFAVKSMNKMDLEKENLLGIATGPWNIIKNCEKTGNFTSLN